MAGHIRESKLDNGNIGLEITYGGKENPFRGVDASAPRMYIDRGCFSATHGFLVLDEQLVACGWLLQNVNLQSWNTANTYLGSGTWYVNGAYKNFVIAAFTFPLVSPPATRITFSIWTWPSGSTGNIPLTAALSIVQTPESSSPTPANAQLYISNGYTVTVPTVITISVAGIPVNVTYQPTPTVPFTAMQLASAIVAAINGTVGYPCTAALNSDGLTVDLTTTATGSAANSTTLGLSYAPSTRGGIGFSNSFYGGSDGVSLPAGQFFNPLSWVAEGESLIFAGVGGTMMLQYKETGGTPALSVLTQYLCASSLAKFNGQLIAAGFTCGPGLRIDTPEMVVAWSAPNQFGVWNPLNADGTVTGAGFNQETDIADYLTGMLIGNGCAIILRTQGIDYMTPLSGGVIPFDFVHVSNSVMGEGCQDGRLITQYDRVGAFIGNSDVYEFSSDIKPIGAKIKNLIQPGISSTIYNRAAASGLFMGMSGFVCVLYIWILDNMMYFYEPQDGTWMEFFLTGLGGLYPNFDISFWTAFSSIVGQPQFNTPKIPILARQDPPFTSAPIFYSLNPTVQNSDYTYSSQSLIIFPQEEIAVGRDITIESLTITLRGVPGQQITFTINGEKSIRDGGGSSTSMTVAFTVPSSASTILFDTYQVFFTQFSPDKLTIQNPYLTILVPVAAGGTTNILNIAKVVLYGSYDPAQRPV